MLFVALQIPSSGIYTVGVTLNQQLCISYFVSLTLYDFLCITFFVSLTLFIKKLKMVFQLKRKTVPMAVKDIPIHLNSKRYFIM